MQQFFPDDVIWRNVRLATMDPERNTPYGLVEGHALIVRQGKIRDIVPESSLYLTHDNTFDMQGRLITPGLIDCHTHLVFGGNRAGEWEQRLNGVSYQQISAQGGGINATVSATRSASDEQLLHLAHQRMEQLIKEGVTLLEIKSGYGLDLQTEEKILRVAAALAAENIIEISPTLLAAHATPAEYRDDPDGYITLVCETILPQLWEQGLFETVDLFCESVGFSLTQSERVFQAAQALGIPIKGHVEQLSLLGGAQLVSRYHGLSADHIEYLDEAGVAAMSQSGTVGVLLPGAFYFLKEQQLPPVALLRQYQVPMAVATDFNPGTSPFISLHWAMNMACVQFGLTPEEAWAGVTRHAARALGRHATHGQLKAGFVADFVVWDALRLFQTITLSPTFSPEMYREKIALLGFACDEGVKRNQGRTGAAGAPDVLRKALANLAATMGIIGWWIWEILWPRPPTLRARSRRYAMRCSAVSRRIYVPLFWEEDTKPHLRTAQACWMCSRRRKWGLSTSMRTSICAMPSRLLPVHRFANWRSFAMNSSGNFTMPVSVSVGRQTPWRYGMRRSGSV